MGTRKGYATTRSAPKGWHEMWAQRLMGALCRDLPGFAWTADDRPDEAEMSLMRQTCCGCPVRLECTAYALDDRLPAQGGMYAGVWIPWQPANGATEASTRTAGWRAARDRLRKLYQDLQFDALMQMADKRAESASAPRNHRPLSLTRGKA